MDTVTYPDPDVAEFLHQHFIPVRGKIKEQSRLAEEYLVRWTPCIVFSDETGKVHSRIEGFLPPEAFLAQLSLSAGRFWLDRGQFDKGRERFEEVAHRHQGSE